MTTTAVQPDTASAGSALTTNAGSPVTFSQATATGTGPLTYAWNFGDGTTATATGTLNPSHTYQNPGTFTAQLTVTDALGIPAMSTVTVTVNPTTPTLPSPIAGTNYQLVWMMSSMGRRFNTSNWPEIGWGSVRLPRLAPDFSYNTSNVFVKPMVTLTITAVNTSGAVPVELGLAGFKHGEYPALWLQYGFFEVSAKLPAYGPGFWPAILVV